MRLAALAFSLLVVAAPFAAHSEGRELRGTWRLTHDPDGPVTEDWMRFGAGAVQLGNEKGVYITCPYQATQFSVLLRCRVRGEEKELTMLVKSGFRQLVNPSGAIYTRQ